MSNDNGKSDNTSTESGTTRTGGNNLHGSWEIPKSSTSSAAGQRSQAAHARGGRGENSPPPESQRLVVWRRSSAGGCRHGHSALVQGVGEGLVAVGWIFVEDLTGTHRDEYFFTTDVDLTPKQIIEAYTDRWAIEVMFEETREHVGIETTRGRFAQTILRAEPRLFGLYTLITLWFAELPDSERKATVVGWSGSVQKTLTFSDAITLVRRHIWRFWVLEGPRHATAFQKLTPREKSTMVELLTQAM